MKKTFMLYHGSAEIVRQPQYGKGRTDNDYGQGFYCTENRDLAGEWACPENKAGFINCYELESEGLRILNLSNPDMTILHWLALLVSFRHFRLSTPLMTHSVQWLQNTFFISPDSYDLVIGYRADDSYFSFARSFLNNEISLSQLSRAMRLGRPGEQIVLKSPSAFQRIHFLSQEEADCQLFYPRRKRRDRQARQDWQRELELETDDLSGLFIRDMLKEGVRPDDARLR